MEPDPKQTREKSLRQTKKRPGIWVGIVKLQNCFFFFFFVTEHGILRRVKGHLIEGWRTILGIWVTNGMAHRGGATGFPSMGDRQASLQSMSQSRTDLNLSRSAAHRSGSSGLAKLACRGISHPPKTPTMHERS